MNPNKEEIDIATRAAAAFDRVGNTSAALELRAAISAAPQVVAGERAVGVRWDLFPGWLIDHCEGNTISEEGLQGAVADMLKSNEYHAALAAAPVQAQEPVAEVSSMPGTSGFTMAAFKADDMPIGSKIYRAPVQPVAVPDGWKMVPIKLTLEMILAGENADPERESSWDAYLAAAPAAPAAQGDAKDAERYRWLTTTQGLRYSPPGGQAIVDIGEMNAAIDAAISAEKEAS